MYCFFFGFWAAVAMNHFWIPMSLWLRLPVNVIFGCSATVLWHCLGELGRELRPRK